MSFEIIGEITDIETIAVGSNIRDVQRLQKHYGTGRWRKRKGIARIRLADERIRLAELHWYQAHGIGKKETSANAIWTEAMKRPKHKTPLFAVCINNAEYPASLELHKIYRVIPDKDVGQDGDIRVIDESGEDYLYPAEWFAMVEIPGAVQDSILRVA